MLGIWLTYSPLELTAALPRKVQSVPTYADKPAASTQTTLRTKPTHKTWGALQALRNQDRTRISLIFRYRNIKRKQIAEGLKPTTLKTEIRKTQKIELGIIVKKERNRETGL